MISKQIGSLFGSNLYSYFFPVFASGSIKANIVPHIMQISRMAKRNSQNIVSNNIDFHSYDTYQNTMERNQCEFYKHIDVINSEIAKGSLNHVQFINEEEKADFATALDDIAKFNEVRALYEQMCLLKQDVDQVNYLALDRFNERESQQDPNLKTDALHIVNNYVKLLDSCKTLGITLWESKLREELGMQVMRMIKVLRLEDELQLEGGSKELMKFNQSEQFA